MSQHGQYQDQLDLRLQRYHRNRRQFALRVYLLAIIFVMITVVQWLPAILVDDIRNFLVDYFYVAMIGIFIAILVITIFVFVEDARFVCPLNCLLAFLIVEGVTIGLARAVVTPEFTVFGISFAVTTFMLILFIIFGLCVEHDFTLDVIVLFVCAILFFVSTVFFVFLHLLGDLPYSMYIYAAFVIVIVVFFTMYHAQAIHGSRYAEMRLKDFLLGSLIIYHDFIILFIMIFYIISTIW